MAKLGSEFAECSRLAESQKREIIALRAKIEPIKACDEILLYVMGTHGVQQASEHEGAHAPADLKLSPEV